MTLTNLEDAFAIQKNMLMITGVWPNNKRTFSYTIRTILSWVLIILLAVTMWMEFFKIINDFTKLSEIVYIMMMISGAIIKQASFCYHSNDILKLLKLLKNPLFYSHTKAMDFYMATTVRQSIRLANIYRYSIALCILFIGVFPIIDGKDLPFPFSYNFGKFRMVVYVMQIICESVSAWNNLCMDIMCTSLMGIAAAQLDILAGKIESICIGQSNYLNSVQKDSMITKKLQHCVEHHLVIMKLIEYIERIFTIGLLAQFLTSCIVICNTGFQFVLIPLSAKFIMLINYLIIVLIQLFIYCWYGSEIIDKTENIGKACYKFKWYNYGNSVRQYIFIMMERSKRPLVITAMKWSALSLISFTSILRWSYSILAVLLNAYKKK